MTFMTTNLTRYIRSGHAGLGVAGAAGLTLIGNGHNASPLWSRNAASGPGQLHTWSPWGSGNPAEGLPGFNGERIDPVSGNYHLGNGYRAYNPVLGRFNCPDSLSPFGAGGINPYVYCGGDPVNYTDPTGHISWQSILGIIFGIIGLGLSLFTAGLSIAAAGGISAALSSASATTLALGGLGVLADVTAIASGATEDVNPEASSVLGWVSMATGIAGMAASGGALLRSRRVTDHLDSTENIAMWYTHPPKNKFDSFYLANTETGEFSRIRLELNRTDSTHNPYPLISTAKKRYYGFSRYSLNPNGKWSISNEQLAYNNVTLSKSPREGYYVYDTSGINNGVHFGNKIISSEAAALPTGITQEQLKTLALQEIDNLGNKLRATRTIINKTNPSEMSLSYEILKLLNSTNA
ncbi:RHS repeat-associated core domain [Cedecea davisae]|nr:RHS repeat-associated core domain-containing protein [Cedecea davisae]SUX27757.1 RHS repeat-associated core domain [Cedecea davisae]